MRYEAGAHRRKLEDSQKTREREAAEMAAAMEEEGDF